MTIVEHKIIIEETISLELSAEDPAAEPLDAIDCSYVSMLRQSIENEKRSNATCCIRLVLEKYAL